MPCRVSCHIAIQVSRFLNDFRDSNPGAHNYGICTTPKSFSNLLSAVREIKEETGIPPEFLTLAKRFATADRSVLPSDAGSLDAWLAPKRMNWAFAAEILEKTFLNGLPNSLKNVGIGVGSLTVLTGKIMGLGSFCS